MRTVQGGLSLTRRLVSGAVLSLVLTLASLVALHAASAMLTVTAVAAMTVALAWMARLSGDETTSGLAAANPAWALALVLVRRHRVAELLPLLVSQALAALLAGVAVRALTAHLGEPQLFTEPSWTATVFVSLLAAVVGSWAVLAVDADGPEALLAVSPVLAGAAPTVVLVTVSNPAVALGAAASGLLPWPIALVAGACGLLGALVGTYAIALITPSESP